MTNLHIWAAVCLYYYLNWNTVIQISDACTTRSDVIAIKEEMDRRLKQFGSEGIGLCRKRREVFSQAFGKYRHTKTTWGCFTEKGIDFRWNHQTSINKLRWKREAFVSCLRRAELNIWGLWVSILQRHRSWNQASAEAPTRYWGLGI